MTSTLDQAATIVQRDRVRPAVHARPIDREILLAWYERHITGHLEHLTGLRDQAGDAGERLEAVLENYPLITHQ